MEFVWGLLKDTVLYVLGTLWHNLPALVIGVLVAGAMQVYVDPDRMRNWLMRRSAVSVPDTVLFGAFTPFCACGTMAVVLSMVATALPWGPVMAFLTSSPLMSPEGFILLSGVVSPVFAISLAVASVLIGLGSGYATHVIERKTGILKDQLRFASKDAGKASGSCGCTGQLTPVAKVSCCSAAEEDTGCDCGGEQPVTAGGCGCGTGALAMEPPMQVKPIGSFFAKYKVDKLLKAVFEVGVLRILPLFALFAGIGYLINRFIPQEWISALFGQNNIFAVPLAALLGLPLYVNGDASVPLIQSLLASGVSPGAMLAFMITGPGTSAGVLAGLATILKRKAIGLYVAYLLGGAILLGYLYELIFTVFG